MKLPSILTLDKTRRINLGFTLIEILLALSIIAALSVVGLIAGLDSYQRYLFRSDLEKAVSLLQKARSAAMNNIGEKSHGVYFQDPAAFVLFRGTSYAARNSSFDLLVEKSKTVAASGLAEAVFTRLSGTTTGGNITLSDGIRNINITINNEGGINW